MKKSLFVGLVTTVLLAGISSVSLAIPIQSETPDLNPASTANLWAYSYQDNAMYITSARNDWVRAGDPYTDAIFQGYVTGDYGVWSNSSDSFDSNGLSDYRSVHVFDTYITSYIDQEVTFRAGGDDGHSIFIDDVFQSGQGFGTTAATTLNMTANTQYKLTFTGNNFTGPYAWWFAMGGEGWSGPISEAYNISMDASASASASSVAPVPEPATMLLFGIGLASLAGFCRRKIQNNS